LKRDDILNFLKEHKDEFKQKYSVEKIGLFGSYARDEATQESDIDIFVEMKPDLFMMVGLKDEIEEEFHKKVDLISKHKNMKPILKEMITKDIIYV
jgi:uncharacterized protein